MKTPMKFLAIAIVTMLLSAIGIIVFLTSGEIIPYPTIFLVMFFVGLGWCITAVYMMHTAKEPDPDAKPTTVHTNHEEIKADLAILCVTALIGIGLALTKNPLCLWALAFIVFIC